MAYHVFLWQFPKFWGVSAINGLGRIRVLHYGTEMEARQQAEDMAQLLGCDVKQMDRR